MIKIILSELYKGTMAQCRHECASVVCIICSIIPKCMLLEDPAEPGASPEGRAVVQQTIVVLRLQ